jgi:hypothetical protein
MVTRYSNMPPSVLVFSVDEWLMSDKGSSERTHKLLINHSLRLRSQPDLVWLTNFHVGEHLF